MRKGIRAIFPWVLLASALLVAPDAFAGTSGASSVTQTFINATTGWYAALKTIAEEIFYALFGVDFVYLVAQWLIGGKDVHEVFTSFIKKLLTIGTFFTILINGHELIGWVVNGFQQSGVAAAGQPHTGMGWILSTGGQFFITCLQGPMKSGGGKVGFLFNMVTSGGQNVLSVVIGALTGLVVGIIAILALIYLALEYLAIQLEAALVASVGIIMLGFAGSRWTVQHAEGYLKYALSVGVRFMVLVIWIAFIENNSTGIIDNLLSGVRQDGGSSIGTAMGAYANVLIFVLLIAWMAKKLPSIASSVMTGGSSLSGGELFAGGVAAAAVGAAAVVTGGAALAGAGAGGGMGALTGAQAAAMDAGAAGGTAGSLGAGGGAAGGALPGAMDGGAAHAVEAPPSPFGGGPAGGGGAGADNAVPAPGYDYAGPAQGFGGNTSAGGGSDKPMSLAERFAKHHAKHQNFAKTAEQLLMPGEKERSGVQAGGLGLKHSE
ncbi:MAG: P-type conjugative transfer protein TrbL [Acidithiobacillus sp.]